MEAPKLDVNDEDPRLQEDTTPAKVLIGFTMEELTQLQACCSTGTLYEKLERARGILSLKLARERFEAGP